MQFFGPSCSGWRLSWPTVVVAGFFRHLLPFIPPVCTLSPLFIGLLFFVAPYLPLACFSFRYKLCVLARLRSRKDLCNRLLSICIHALLYSVMFLYARFASNIRFVQCYFLGFLQVCTLWEFLRGHGITSRQS